MSMTDPIADMLTRIRNASKAGHEKVDIPRSNMKEEIARILKREGYVSDFKSIENRLQGILRLHLKYAENRQPVLSGLKRVSKPGLRVYVGYGDLPRVLGGLGEALISTSKGLMTDSEARKGKLGGEVICYIW